MAKNYAALANDVVSALGGKENIVAVTHCMTRLRFVVKDETRASTPPTPEKHQRRDGRGAQRQPVPGDYRQYRLPGLTAKW